MYFSFDIGEVEVNQFGGLLIGWFDIKILGKTP
jgi:hypothetical protein